MKTPHWEDIDRLWEQQSRDAARRRPLSKPASPNIPTIMPSTRRWLRLKALLWVIQRDSSWTLCRFFVHHLWKHSWTYLKSSFTSSFHHHGDLFFYGISSIADLEHLFENPATHLVVGCSYCQRPHECPYPRYSSICHPDSQHDVCRQCFFHRIQQTLPQRRTTWTIVPTVNDIGHTIVNLLSNHHPSELCFVISSCEMSLTMFRTLGRIAGIRGIGIRLEGRYCNTMEAFKRAEYGVKPGLTWLSQESEHTFIQLLRSWYSLVSSDPLP